MKKSDRQSLRVLKIGDNNKNFVQLIDFLPGQVEDIVIEHATYNGHALKSIDVTKWDFDVWIYHLSVKGGWGHRKVYEILKLSLTCPLIVVTWFKDTKFGIQSIADGVSDYLMMDDINTTTLAKSIFYAIERKKHLFQIKQSEKRYCDLFNLSPQPMWVYHIKTLKFMDVNLAAIKQYKYSRDEFLNMTILDLRSNTAQLAESTISENAGIKRPIVYKYRVIHYKKSGEKVEDDIYCTPLSIDGQSLISVIAIDNTEINYYERKITKAIIKTQEDERYEFGSELHDNVCQILATSQVTLGLLKGALSTEETFLFNKCSESIGLALNEIRSLSHRLAPAFYSETSLEEALSKLFNNFHFGNKFEIFLKIDPYINEIFISLDLQLNLYRIIQEQLRNISKYSHGTKIEVSLQVYKKYLSMRVSDNGVGFNPKTVKEGIGLTNIKRRAELFYGKVQIETSPGQGCRMSVDFPLKKCV